MKPSKGAKKDKPREELFATNHKAGRDYEILDTFEAGIVLKGTEIKSIRQRRVSIDDSFARIDGDELFLYNMHISAYEQGGRWNVEPTRIRKLLVHRHEIDKLHGGMTQRRLTLIPLRLYQRNGRAKVALALCKGKRLFEKRERIREREVDRDLRRRLRHPR
jgi:SsrA-binding protein